MRCFTGRGACDDIYYRLGICPSPEILPIIDWPYSHCEDQCPPQPNHIWNSLLCLLVVWAWDISKLSGKTRSMADKIVHMSRMRCSFQILSSTAHTSIMSPSLNANTTATKEGALIYCVEYAWISNDSGTHRSGRITGRGQATFPLPLEIQWWVTILTAVMRISRTTMMYCTDSAPLWGVHTHSTGMNEWYTSVSTEDEYNVGKGLWSMKTHSGVYL